MSDRLHWWSSNMGWCVRQRPFAERSGAAWPGAAPEELKGITDELNRELVA